jgi:hypothetical protein
MVLLHALSYVKAKPLIDAKALWLEEVIEEIKLVRAGKKEARDAKVFLNELSSKDPCYF